MAGLLCVTAARAQQARPLPSTAPVGVPIAGHRIHVEAHEDLDPDRLRAFARPGVTLWLRTRSNTLRASTLEHLGRFDEAFVEVRAPWSLATLRSIARGPGVGAWVRGPWRSLPSARPPAFSRIALDGTGALGPEASALISAWRPNQVRWAPTEAPDLLSWGLFVQGEGRRTVALPTPALVPTTCATRRAAGPALEVDSATLLALSADVFPCGAGQRVVLRPGFDPPLLQGLLARDPSLELVFKPGLDDEVARATAKYLDGLGLPRR